MFCTDEKIIIARKEHLCTWCGQSIAKGEKHFMWKSVEDSWFTNRMHGECYEAQHTESLVFHDNTYTPFENERPEARK